MNANTPPSTSDKHAARVPLKGLLGIVAISILLDQLTKQWALDALGHLSYPVYKVTDFFNFVLVWNRGVSFGVMGDGNARWALVALTSIITLVMIRWMLKSSAKWEQIGLAFIIGGAIGNLSDRIFFGAVIDFLDFHVFGWHFWAFNLADSAITVGVIALLLDSLLQKPTEDKTQA